MSYLPPQYGKLRTIAFVLYGTAVLAIFATAHCNVNINHTNEAAVYLLALRRVTATGKIATKFAELIEQ